MSILRVKDDKGNIIPIPAIKGDKGDRGDSGVYVGSGAIPNGCNVKIDPNGEADDVVTRAEFEELNKNLIMRKLVTVNNYTDNVLYTDVDFTGILENTNKYTYMGNLTGSLSGSGMAYGCKIKIQSSTKVRVLVVGQSLTSGDSQDVELWITKKNDI